jgi:hypothetical protein
MTGTTTGRVSAWSLLTATLPVSVPAAGCGRDDAEVLHAAPGSPGLSSAALEGAAGGEAAKSPAHADNRVYTPNRDYADCGGDEVGVVCELAAGLVACEYSGTPSARPGGAAPITNYTLRGRSAGVTNFDGRSPSGRREATGSRIALHPNYAIPPKGGRAASGAAATEIRL